MPNDTSLMAHLVPRLTSQVENAATEALAYILNSSSECMTALNDLLQEGGFAIEPIARAGTQVTYEDGSRPDMAGYDKNSVTCLLVEAKFWAALLEGQASGYSRHLDQPGPAVMMLISPEVRIPNLWVEIRRQMEGEGTVEIMEPTPGVRRAKVVRTEPGDTELQVMLVSWTRLLNRMDALASDDAAKSDIRQLRGLAQRADAEAFLPLHIEDMNPIFARRMVEYNRLVDDVVDSRGVSQGWMSVKGLMATSRRWGYGRYFRYSDNSIARDMWFGINLGLWAEEADTPLWLGMYEPIRIDMEAIGRKLELPTRQYSGGVWLPILLKTGVEYHEVLDNVASQLKRIGEIALANPKSPPTPESPAP